MGYSPWGRKESGMTERLTLTYLLLSSELSDMYSPLNSTLVSQNNMMSF